MIASRPLVGTIEASMDWVGILRELRFLITQLQTDRFYALYGLLAIFLIAYLIKKY